MLEGFSLVKVDQQYVTDRYHLQNGDFSLYFSFSFGMTPSKQYISGQPAFRIGLMHS